MRDEKYEDLSYDLMTILLAPGIYHKTYATQVNFYIIQLN